jgi:hypothetical protein
VTSPCDTCAASKFCRHPTQPGSDEFTMADGVFVKTMDLPVAGMIVPQHSHAYDHTSFLATGSVHVWTQGRLTGEFRAPHPIFIKAGVKHAFQSLEPNTLILCIHNTSRTGAVEVVEENHLVGADTSCLSPPPPRSPQ